MVSDLRQLATEANEGVGFFVDVNNVLQTQTDRWAVVENWLLFFVITGKCVCPRMGKITVLVGSV